MNVRRFTAIAILALMVIAILAACDSGSSRVHDAPDVPADGASSATSNRQHTASEPGAGSDGITGYHGPMFSDTIEIDGRPHRVRLARVGDTLPFSTAYPVDEMQLRIGKSEQGTGVRFLALIDGEPDDDAYIHVFLPAFRMNVDQMQTMVESGLTDRGVHVRPSGGSGACPWAERSLQLSDDYGYSGQACIGWHYGTAFYVLQYYPDSLADELLPRFQVIRDHFRWNDGTSLSASR